MLSCWKSKPKDRPTFTFLKLELDKLLSEETADNEYLVVTDCSSDRLWTKEFYPFTYSSITHPCLLSQESSEREDTDCVKDLRVLVALPKYIPEKTERRLWYKSTFKTFILYVLLDKYVGLEDLETCQLIRFTVLLYLYTHTYTYEYFLFVSVKWFWITWKKTWL